MNSRSLFPKQNGLYLGEAYLCWLPGGSEVKATACNMGDLGSTLAGRSPGEGNGNPLRYSCLENPMDGGAWWATVQEIAKSWTRLSDFSFTLSDAVFQHEAYEKI